ncbi:MAG TPA: hypothetical protein VM305_02065 [Candidatus Limnocylindrales bacterium]|nr:hypothetical protein [Candidatus Limnocylindrales bacterium]
MGASPEVVAAALEQVELGFAVFALGVDSKVPVTERGFKNAARDPAWVRTQLSAPSAGNYGMTGPKTLHSRCSASTSTTAATVASGRGRSA